MPVTYQIKDLGKTRRIQASGLHYHYLTSKKACKACVLDVPFSIKFLEKLITWDNDGLFHFIEGRLLNESYYDIPKRMIKKYCPHLRGKEILDFGSGLGQMSPLFIEQGADHIVLAEIDEQLLDLSAIYLTELGHQNKCDFILIKETDDLSCIKDESFDIIAAFEVFEHIMPERRKSTLKSIYSKLNANGILLITSPNRLFPKDLHTTGLWFTTWLPIPISAWYARTFATWRWRGYSTRELLRQGLNQYSYFEANRVLKLLGARNLCTFSLPIFKDEFIPFKKRFLIFLYRYFLKFLGPWEAWQPVLELAWSKPMR